MSKLSRYNNIKESLLKRAENSSQGLEDRSGGTKEPYIFLNRDKEIVGDKPFNIYKPKITTGQNKNMVDVLPFPISMSWYTDMRGYNKAKVGIDVGEVDYKLELPLHTLKVGGKFIKVVCLRELFGEDCYICERMFEKYAERKGKSDAEAKVLKEFAGQLQPTWRDFYNVFDYAEPEKEIQVMEMPYSYFEKALQVDSGLSKDNLDDGQEWKPIMFFCLENGMTLKFKGNSKPYKIGKNSGESVIITEFDFVAREQAYDDSVLDQTYPLDKMFNIPTYDETKELYNKAFGIIEDDNSSVDSSVDSTSVDNGATNVAACPEGGTFGKDCNHLPECAACTVFNSCSAKQVEAANDAIASKPPEDKKDVPKKSFGDRVK